MVCCYFGVVDWSGVGGWIDFDCLVVEVVFLIKVFDYGDYWNLLILLKILVVGDILVVWVVELIDVKGCSGEVFVSVDGKLIVVCVKGGVVFFDICDLNGYVVIEVYVLIVGLSLFVFKNGDWLECVLFKVVKYEGYWCVVLCSYLFVCLLLIKFMLEFVDWVSLSVIVEFEVVE